MAARKANWRTVKMLVDELGAEFLVNPPVYEPYNNDIQKFMTQKKMQAAREPGDEKYLFPSVERTTRVTILWDHFHPARSFPRVTLRSTLGSGHVYDDDVAHVWAVPRDLGRPPLASEIAEYRQRTLAAIDAADCAHVMLLGKAAISLWRPDLKPMQVAGGTFVWGDHFVYPTIHPSAIAMDGQNVQTWREGMKGLARSIFEGEIRYGTHCILCDYRVDVYDKNAVPYCSKHFNANAVNKEVEWKKKQNKAQQGRLM